VSIPSRSRNSSVTRISANFGIRFICLCASLAVSQAALAATNRSPIVDDLIANSRGGTSATTCDAGSHKSEPADAAKNSSPNKDANDASEKTAPPSNAPSVEDRIRALEEALRQQNQRLEEMGKTIEDQRRTIESLENANQQTDMRAAAVAAAAAPGPAGNVTAANTSSQSKTDVAADPAQKRLDELYKKFGPIRFSGDLRFRVETFDNQGFDALTEPPGRYRMRLRARLAMDGALGKKFDWGLRIATGTFTDPITTNQTFTDFFERKPFMLDRAFVHYDSKGEKVGVEFYGGKFDPPFRRTQMIWDDDINVEGASEAIYFKTKSALKQFKVVAFQLPFSEISAGKDSILYGGQAQTDWKLSTAVSANVNFGLYDWVHPDTIVTALGAATTQVNGGITNGAAVTGGQNGALGTTNRIVRNAAGVPIGFLAGFNLFDVLGNLTYQFKKYPLTFTFDYVHNMTGRVRDEKNAFWVGGQLGQTREKGDWMVNYYFTRIEQDAVLVPFNFSDILASNSRVHMPSFAYQIASGVTLQWTGLFSQRANKLFITSPENRFLVRQQFDVIYKF